MRRLSLVIFILFFGIVIFFTLTGNAIYDWITPEVSIAMVNRTIIHDGMPYYKVSEDVLNEDGTVFEIVSEFGFSRELFYLRKIEIHYIDDALDWEDGYIYVAVADLRPGTQLLLFPNASYHDNSRVRIGKKIG